MKPKIEKAYQVVEQYNFKGKYTLIDDDGVDDDGNIKSAHVAKIVIEDDKVYIQSDPYESSSGELVIKRLAEFNMTEATKLLFDAANNKV